MNHAQHVFYLCACIQCGTVRVQRAGATSGSRVFLSTVDLAFILWLSGVASVWRPWHVLLSTESLAQQFSKIFLSSVKMKSCGGGVLVKTGLGLSSGCSSPWMLSREGADIPGRCLAQLPFSLSNSGKSHGVLNWWVPSSRMRLKPEVPGRLIA